MNLQKLAIAIAVLVAVGYFAPIHTFAAGAKQFHEFRITSTISDEITISSLVLKSSKLTISGTAESGVRTVRVTVRNTENAKTLYNKKIRVTNEKWKAKIPKKLSLGSYNVEVSIASRQVGNRVSSVSATSVHAGRISGILEITKNQSDGPKSSANLVVGSVPLLFGGTVRAGASAPVAYLQITNTGREATTLKGFGVKQTGSASSRSVIGFTAVDDNGGSRSFVGESEGQPLFRNGLAFVPIEATFEPGQMKLFTIKALLASDIRQDIGKQLIIDVVSIRANAWIQGQFPIQGTIWTISI